MRGRSAVRDACHFSAYTVHNQMKRLDYFIFKFIRILFGSYEEHINLWTNHIASTRAVLCDFCACSIALTIRLCVLNECVWACETEKNILMIDIKKQKRKLIYLWKRDEEGARLVCCVGVTSPLRTILMSRQMSSPCIIKKLILKRWEGKNKQ